MWDWTVRSCNFENSVLATAAGGFARLSYPWRKYKAELARGRRIEDLNGIAAVSGVKLDILDGFTGWTPKRFPDDAPEIVRDAFDFGPDEAIALCARAGFKTILAFGGFDPGIYPQTMLIDAFGSFCDKAAGHDLEVALEPIVPLGGLRTLAAVSTIVRGANRPNGSIMLDSWHFMRGGADFALLESLPRGAIRHVQLGDGPLKRPTADLRVESDHLRELPGYGEMPLAKIMSILLRTQDLATIGPEAKSDRLDRLSPQDIGRQAATSVTDLLSKAERHLSR